MQSQENATQEPPLPSLELLQQSLEATLVDVPSQPSTPFSSCDRPGGFVSPGRLSGSSTLTQFLSSPSRSPTRSPDRSETPTPTQFRMSTPTFLPLTPPVRTPPTVALSTTNSGSISDGSMEKAEILRAPSTLPTSANQQSELKHGKARQDDDMSRAVSDFVRWDWQVKELTRRLKEATTKRKMASESISELKPTRGFRINLAVLPEEKLAEIGGPGYFELLIEKQYNATRANFEANKNSLSKLAEQVGRFAQYDPQEIADAIMMQRVREAAERHRVDAKNSILSQEEAAVQLEACIKRFRTDFPERQRKYIVRRAYKTRAVVPPVPLFATTTKQPQQRDERGTKRKREMSNQEEDDNDIERLKTDLESGNLAVAMEAAKKAFALSD